MIGVSTAYFLAKKGGYDITVIDKEYPIRGASEQNANTITFIPYPAWTTMNIWKVLKDNLMMKENPTSYIKFSLIFDSHFRFWLKHYMKNRKTEHVERSNNALAKLISYSISLYDGYINEVTDSTPDAVEYHEEVLTNVYRNLDEKTLKEKVELLEVIKKYDPTCRRVPPEELTTFKDASIVFKLAVRCLNTAKFCDFMRTKLIEKYGVNFVQGDIKSVTYTDNSIKSLEYESADKTTHKVNNVDKYVFCGGVESVNLGKLVGLQVPIFGFKGHSLNMYMDKSEMPDSTYIFIPENIAVSRVGYNTSGMVRVTGFADVVGLNLDTIDIRKKQITEIAKKFLGEKHFNESKANYWVGLRPVCADDVPLIGKSSKFNNLY